MKKTKTNDSSIQRIRELLKKHPLIDGHNDTPWRFRREHQNNLDAVDFSKDTRQVNPLMKTDIPRLRSGGVGGQFWSVFVPDKWANQGAAKSVREQIALVHQLAKKYPQHLEMAFSSDDVKRIHASGKIACLIGLEGGHSIDGSPDVLREFYKSGARYMTLACAESSDLADSATGKRLHGGLSSLGKNIIEEMNRIGMMIDLSHCSDETMKHALDLSKAPVIFSHSCVRSLCPSPRNVPDDILRKLAQSRGVIMITFVPMFLNNKAWEHHERYHAKWKEMKKQFPDDQEQVKQELKKWEQEHPFPPAFLSEVADHIDHAKKVTGIDCLGIGSDFGGFRNTPRGLEDVSQYPALLAELASRGYSDEDIIKIAGANILRVMRDVEEIAGNHS